MCSPRCGGRSDRDILDFLADRDYEGDLSPSIARDIAVDYLAVYPRDGSKPEKALVSLFKGEDGKTIPLNVHRRKELADFIFPPIDSS